MQQIILGLIGSNPVVQPGGAVRHSHPGSVQHRALFPLELWVLPYISSPLPLCSGTVLPLLLHLPSGEAGGGTRQRHPCLPQALFLLPMGGIGGRNRTFDPSHPLDGRSLLRPDVPLGQLWGTPRPSGFCPGPRPSLLFGGGMVSGKPSPRPSLPAHRLAFLMCLSPAAPLARPSRGALLPHLSPGIGGTGSRLLPPAGCLVGQGGTEYPRPSPPLPHPEKRG